MAIKWLKARGFQIKEKCLISEAAEELVELALLREIKSEKIFTFNTSFVCW